MTLGLFSPCWNAVCSLPWQGTGATGRSWPTGCARIISVIPQLLSVSAEGQALQPPPFSQELHPTILLLLSARLPEVTVVPPRAGCCPFCPKIRAPYPRSQQCWWEGILRVCSPTSPGAETPPAPPQGSRGCVQPKPPWTSPPCFAGHLEREFFLRPNLHFPAALPVVSPVIWHPWEEFGSTTAGAAPQVAVGCCWTPSASFPAH